MQVLILGSLSHAFPSDRFIAEESGGELLKAGSSTRSEVMAAVAAHSPSAMSETEALQTLDLGGTGLADGWSRTGRTWVLDPVDGTKGFLRGDQFAVALSLLDGGVPVLGLLGCPNMGSSGALFWAERGNGAQWGATHGAAADEAAAPLRVTDPGPGALVRCEAFEAAHTDFGAAEAIATRLGITNAPIRMDGQGKYGMLARGDAHVFTRLPREGYQENIWDHAAGALIVNEAGGRVTDTLGRELDFSRGAKLDASVTGIVASNGVVHEQLLEVLSQVL